MHYRNMQKLSLFTALTFASSVLAKSLVVFKSDAAEKDILFHVNLFSYYSSAQNIQSEQPSWFSFKENGVDIMGYSADIPNELELIISNQHAVDYIEEDSPVYAMAPFTFVDDEGAVQHGAPWPLVRISHRESNGGKGEMDYLYQSADGEGVTVYVIDTGIYINHEEFEGRAKWGTSTVNDMESDYLWAGRGGKTDGNGHGTHCAGIIGSMTFGVCKSCKLVAVQVLNSFGQGSTSGVISGIDWVAQDHERRMKKDKNKRARSVANVSLGGGKSVTMNRAINAAANRGVHFAVAAGNEYSDACNVSPASAENVTTVGASDVRDNMASFSNFGECVDVFAPGVMINSTWNEKHSHNVISGTSMAAPHVAGAIAVLLSRYADRDFSPEEMTSLVKRLATKDTLSRIPEDTDNLLLFTDPEGRGKRDVEDDDVFRIQI
jgi:cerevisin